MTPVDNVQLQKIRDGRLRLTFDYPAVVPGFEHALVLVPEQDGIGDNWSLRPRLQTFNTAAGRVSASFLDYFNDTHGRFWNVGSSAGSEDDTGNRRFVRRMAEPFGSATSNFTVFYFQGQPDETQTSTTPQGLEFYAVVAVVGLVSGLPAVQLGDIAFSNQIAGA